MRKQVAVAFALLTASTAALAAEPAKPAAEPAKPAAEKAAPMTPPAVPAENDVIKKSVGTWSCEGTVKAGDNPEAKYKSSWTVKSMFGGHWYSIAYKRSKMGPMPAFEGSATVGYDTINKHYVLVGFDSMGGWINLTSSDGATYTGDSAAGGKKTASKFAFTPGKDKKGQESDKLFDVTFDFTGVATSHESCKK